MVHLPAVRVYKEHSLVCAMPVKNLQPWFDDFLLKEFDETEEEQEI